MREIAMRFGGEVPLIGVLSAPPVGAPSRDVAVILLNSGLLHRVGAGRFHVLLARTLAPMGFAALRFDFSGTGDSEPRRDGLTFLDSVVAETRSAMDHLAKTRGVERFVLAGLCSGADAAFYTAQADPRVVGLVQLDPFVYRTAGFYLRHYGPKLLNARSWWNVLTGRTYVGPVLRRWLGRSRSTEGDHDGVGDDHYVSPYVRSFPPRAEVRDGLRRLMQRDVRLYHIFSSGQGEHYNHEGQYRSSFPDVPFGDCLTVSYLPEADHVFSGLPHKRFVVSSLAAWMERHWSGAVQAKPGSGRSEVAQPALR